MTTVFEFPLRGRTIPQDHGYLVLSGLSVQYPFFHESPESPRKIQIAPISGTRTKDNRSILLNDHSRLHIRGITNEEALRMRGGYIWVGDQMVFLGPAHRYILNPSSSLMSRLVVLRDTTSPEKIQETLQGWLPGSTVEIGRSHAHRMKGMFFKGCRVSLSGLTSEQSDKILNEGLGRFTRMGCGVFAAVRG